MKARWVKKRKRKIPNSAQGRITPVLKEPEQHRAALALIASYRQVVVARAGLMAGKAADNEMKSN